MTLFITINKLKFQELYKLCESEIMRNYFGYIDVGDGCWRPFMLAKTLRCW